MNETNALLVIIVGVVVAGLTEIIKAIDKDTKLGAGQIELITLALGILAGIGGMYFAQADFAQSVSIGIVGALVSTRVYEFTKNFFGGGTDA